MSKLTRSKIALILVFILQWALLFNHASPIWDSSFYYAYTRSVTFDGDLDLVNDFQLNYTTTGADFISKNYHEILTETGRIESPFAIGNSLLWLPLFLVFRAGSQVAVWAGILPALPTGYEAWFIAGISTLSALAALYAFWLTYCVSAKETGHGVALVALLTLLFANPLLYYQFREPLYSHAASAFIIAVVVYYWWQTLPMPSVKQGIVLGILIGLAALVRWQHLIYVVLPGVASLIWLVQNRSQWRTVFFYLFSVGLTTILIFSPQFSVWKLFYNSWFTVPQGPAYVDWRGLWLLPTLFSPFRGIFLWMPITIPAIFGLLRLAKKRLNLALPLIIVLMLEVYVNASTRDWFAGAGFGPRRFTSEIIIFGIGYAMFLDWLKPYPRRFVAPILAVLFAGQQWILLRYALIEKIGGFNTSMYPTYLWQEVSVGEFFTQIINHVPDVWKMPANFFIFPGSPIDIWQQSGNLPLYLPAITIVTSIFALGYWLVGKQIMKAFHKNATTAWGVGFGILLLINGWILFAA